MNNIRLFNSGLPENVIKKLYRMKITRMSQLLVLNEDSLIGLRNKTYLKRKEIHQIKEYIFEYYPYRFSDDFIFLSDSEVQDSLMVTEDCVESKDKLNETFEALITENNYVGMNGWIEESYIDPTNGEMFDTIIKKFQGKKVQINIKELSQI